MAKLLRNGLVVVGLFAVVLLPALAHAQYPPASNGGGTVSAGNVTAGGSINFSGGGFAPGSTVTLKYTDACGKTFNVGTVTTNSSGSFSANVGVPTGACNGKGSLTGTGVGPGGTIRTIVAGITVSGGSGSTASTGVQIAKYVGAGLAALFIGSLMVAFARRRRVHAAV